MAPPSPVLPCGLKLQGFNDGIKFGVSQPRLDTPRIGIWEIF